MTPFTQPDVRPITGTRPVLYRLHADWTCDWLKDDIQYRLNIPAGFICDLDSTPRWLWWLFGVGRDGPQRAAVTAHDYFYFTAGLNQPKGAFQRIDPDGPVDLRVKCSKDFADRLMFSIMRVSGVPRWQRRAKFRAVQWFGKRAWNAHLARNTAKV